MFEVLQQKSSNIEYLLYLQLFLLFSQLQGYNKEREQAVLIFFIDLSHSSTYGFNIFQDMHRNNQKPDTQTTRTFHRAQMKISKHFQQIYFTKKLRLTTNPSGRKYNTWISYPLSTISQFLMVILVAYSSGFIQEMQKYTFIILHSVTSQNDQTCLKCVFCYYSNLEQAIQKQIIIIYNQYKYS